MDYVLIGRFQPLHRAHQLLIQEALRVSNGSLTLFVGSANKSDSKNPYSFEQRKEVLQKYFPSLRILPLNDTTSNEEWADLILSHFTSPIVLLGSDTRGSLFYKDFFSEDKVIDVIDLSYCVPTSLSDLSATAIRSLMAVGQTPPKEWWPQ